ncbi:hypothetical protein EAX61_03515 [Dokdonia sinensis]|uniref:Uncharacterized protein n=1 Tax=Dokdonia sinensis TaxID=2479847 RepID=A0A3M0GGR4_9FLAO|nr:hypothetical protein [Dokdonia sinensis]RMB63468.1 hypothetical protein EAX61_03515 [Dokdonia sinensis]
MKYLSLFILFITYTTTLAQGDAYEYLGVLKLNDSSFIQYKLALEERDGIIQGYSIADAGGKHETKSNVRGTYDDKANQFAFKEYNIVYTKSPITELDFCLVHFEGKMRKLDVDKGFSGDFTSAYQDGAPCLKGEIIMSSASQVQDRVASIDKKIQKSKKISEEVKEKVSMKRTVDTLTMSVVKKDENLNIFARTKRVVISIYDAGKVDNDRINLYLDGELIIEDYAIEKEKREIAVEITKDFTVIKVVALNEGTSAPNTVKVEILDGMDLITTRTSLKEGESAALTLVKQ